MMLGVYVTGTLYILNSPEATRGIASILIPMMAGLVPFGVVYLIQRVYYAFEDARTPFRLQVIISVVATVAGLGRAAPARPVGRLRDRCRPDPEQPRRCGGRHRLGAPPPGRPAAGLDHPQLRPADPRLAGRSIPAAALAWAVTRAVAGRTQGPVVLLVAGTAFAVIYLLSPAGCASARSTSCSDRCSVGAAASCPGGERPRMNAQEVAARLPPR